MIKKYEKCTFSVSSGKPNAVKLPVKPYDKARMLHDGKRAIALTAVYRIRKTAKAIEFLYNNTVMYSYQKDFKAFDKISISMSCQQEASTVLMEIDKIELRENLKK